MLEAIKDCDVVMGSRYVQGGALPADWGWHRKVLSVLGNCIARFFLTRKYKDFTTGFRATRRAHLIKALPTAFISNGYAYKLELLWRLHQIKAGIGEYPIHFIDRKQGHSKLPTNSISDTLRVLILLRLSGLGTYLRMCSVGAVGACVQFLVYNCARCYLDPFSCLTVVSPNSNHQQLFLEFSTDIQIRPYKILVYCVQIHGFVCHSLLPHDFC